MKRKPCPFCGSEDLRVYSDAAMRWEYVRCVSCDAMGPYIRASENGQLAWDEWNERKGETK